MDRSFLPQAGQPLPQAPQMPQMAPPMGGGPMTPGAPMAVDMDALLGQLRSEGVAAAPREPIYKRGYRKPPKPTLELIWAQAQRAKIDHTWLIQRMYHDLLWLRMALVGAFPEDVEARMQGILMDEVQSPSLAAEWETVCGFLSGLPLQPRKLAFGPETKNDARMIQDAVTYLRRQEQFRWAEQGNGSLAQEEAKYLTMYGRLIDRSVPYLADPEYPFEDKLIDPTTFFPRFDGKKGLARGYHIYRCNLNELLGDYGDVPQRERDKLSNLYGAEYDTDTEVEVVEYWDTWYRSVECTGCVIMPVTEHKYGEVPFTIQFGPSGEPIGSHMPMPTTQVTNSGEVTTMTGRLYDDMVHKGLSYIHYMRREHEQYEAVMSRMLGALKKAIDPPTTLSESNEAAMAPREPLRTTPGAINRLIKGEQEWNPIQTSAPAVDVNALMEGFMQDRGTTRMPMSWQGVNDKSNVSGTAISNLTDAGMEKMGRWVGTLEEYHSRKYTRKLRLYQNFGFLAKYVESQDSPLLIPRTGKVPPGQTPLFELTPELIQRVKPDVQIMMTRARKEQWNALATVGAQLMQIGVATKEMVAEWFGWYDIEAINEQWIEDKGLEMAYSNPDFATFFTIPQAFAQAIAEATGDPVRQGALSQGLQMWMQRFAAPQQQQMAMQQQQALQPPQQPPMGMAPGNPGTSSNVSFPATGQGPGSATGQMGGPPPPPPGSIQIGPPAGR